jgi:two-component system sensor histidine kinase QseC
VEVQPLVRSLDALFGRVVESMESERRFTADAAHELRTPLAAIRTHAEVALAAAGEEERSEALSRVVQGTVRANRVVEQLLTLARLDARELAPVLAPTRLDRIVLEQVGDASVQPAAAERNLGVEGPLEEVLVWGDADLLAIALRNLLDNALRYTRPGDSVDVSVRGEGERVVLVVEDSGLGLPPAQREHVLGRFVRGQGTGAEGSGIGLSIVARIAALHGATLTLGEAARGGLSVEIGLRRAPSSS